MKTLLPLLSVLASCATAPTCPTRRWTPCEWRRFPNLVRALPGAHPTLPGWSHVEVSPYFGFEESGRPDWWEACAGGRVQWWRVDWWGVREGEYWVHSGVSGTCDDVCQAPIKSTGGDIGSDSGTLYINGVTR